MGDGIAYHTPNFDGSAETICRSLALPSFLWPYANGALGELLDERNWYQFGTMSPSEIVQSFAVALDDMRECYMLGSIVSYVRASLPAGVLPCDGSAYSRVDFPALYDVLDSQYIIDSDTFVTPNIDGRFMLGESATYAMGDTGGVERHALSIDEMPTHGHGYGGVAAMPVTAAVPDAVAAMPSPSITDTAGSGLSHENMPPYYVVKYGIVAR